MVTRFFTNTDANLLLKIKPYGDNAWLFSLETIQLLCVKNSLTLLDVEKRPFLIPQAVSFFLYFVFREIAPYPERQSPCFGHHVLPCINVHQLSTRLFANHWNSALDCRRQLIRSPSRLRETASQRCFCEYGQKQTRLLPVLCWEKNNKFFTTKPADNILRTATFFQ